MENLPSEIMCIIFSFLDKESRKNSTETCQLWFDVIRNSNLSNHIYYRGGVEQLQRKIINSRIYNLLHINLEWDWKRWPALKTLEFQGGHKFDLLNDLSIDFKQCPNLEIVIFNTVIDFADMLPNCPQNLAEIQKLAFNPHLDITQFGVDHIWSLKISGLYIQRQNDEVFKLISENIKNIKELRVSQASNFKIQGGYKIQGGSQAFFNDFSIDVKQCQTLEIIIFDVGIGGTDIADLLPNFPRHVADIEKLAFNPQFDVAQFGGDHIWSLYIYQQNDEDYELISENVKRLKELRVPTIAHLENLAGMDSLLELYIEEGSSSELEICGLKNLKVLTVPNLATLNNLAGMDFLLELNVHENDVTEHGTEEFKKYDLSNIAQLFKNLQRFEIYVQSGPSCDGPDDYLILPKKYAKIVENVFQNTATKVKINFGYVTFLTKEPFQRCVVKNKYGGFLDLDNEGTSDSETDDSETDDSEVPEEASGEA